ncbi:bifunctional diguanylate cyclase/phosphodiesterase [Saccharospirillum salsuginis]|uniref:PAS domain S-box-containing protein/diguanylate cyclase (GGDEF) domain-containing protein n=1 Tax=Saccharospirillum salsuginis TaxID=418750 RepID=A0A918NG32_9GAMM|nr:EAL domain-containing protein [Saccharospirillum salsuginis]GGX67954.1 hypothetical protein GCM10007392_39590 [Saccharospirillum salsuginis]
MVFLVLAGLITLSPLFIDWPLPPLGLERYLPLHIIMEVMAVGVAVMIVGVNLSSDVSERSSRSVALTGVFSATALMDLFHLLSYQGMPDFVTPNHPEKAIVFWLVARWLVALVLLYLVWPKRATKGSSMPLRHGHAMAIGIVFALLTTLVILLEPLWLPRTFLPDTGLTPFKIWAERGIVLVNIIALIALSASHPNLSDYRVGSLAMAIATMGFSELYFTLYTNVSDVYNLVGHLFKIVSYAFLYHALVFQAFIRPKEKMRRSESELKATLGAIPDLVVDMDWNGVFHAAHFSDRDMLFDPRLTFIGKRLEDVLPPEAVKAGHDAMREALSNEGVSGAHEYPLFQNGQNRWYEARASVKHPIDPVLPRFIFLIRDITEAKWTLADQQLSAVAFHTREAIMITDVNRRIVRVNQAFTDITGYREEEVLGHKPSVLSSGKHGADFYQRMYDQLDASGVWTGEIWNRRKNGELFVEQAVINTVCDASGAVNYCIASFSDITAYKEAQEQIFQLAFHDPLTHLANRRLMTDRIQEAQAESERSGHYCALLFIDLDNFKKINDSLGHSQGDNLLVKLAERMRQVCRASDSLSRPGGDEFIVLVRQLSEDRGVAAESVEHFAQKLLRSIREPIDLNNRAYSVSASIGIALFRGQNDSIDTLLASADLAMYKSKEFGRDQLCFFDARMQQSFLEKSRRERELKQALVDDQFELHLQSKHTADGGLFGFEALLRWQHPTEGRLSPDRFMELAESSGLIVEIGDWVLRQACRYSLTLGEAEQGDRSALSINISERQMAQENFVERVLTIIEETGADPGRLIFEITETLLHHDLERTRQQMLALNQAGIRFALDDFGTGYSSLAYLQSLPLRILKIDRSFVSAMMTHPASLSIVKAIVSMAKAMNLTLIAEGVETQAQIDILRDLGCHYFQGFYFSRPKPWPDIIASLAPVTE